MVALGFGEASAASSLRGFLKESTSPPVRQDMAQSHGAHFLLFFRIFLEIHTRALINIFVAKSYVLIEAFEARDAE